VEECAAQGHQNLATPEWPRQREMIRALVRRVESGVDQGQVVFRGDAFAGEADPEKKSLQLCKRNRESGSPILLAEKADKYIGGLIILLGRISR
jgi:hypothetical protein